MNLFALVCLWLLSINDYLYENVSNFLKEDFCGSRQKTSLSFFNSNGIFNDFLTDSFEFIEFTKSWDFIMFFKLSAVIIGTNFD